MKLSVLIVIALFGAPALACSMTPMGYSLALVRAAADHIQSTMVMSQGMIRTLEVESGRVRAEITHNEKQVRCEGLVYEISIGADCSTTVTSTTRVACR